MKLTEATVNHIGIHFTSNNDEDMPAVLAVIDGAPCIKKSPDKAAPKPNTESNDARLNLSIPDFKAGKINTAPISPTAGAGHKKKDKVIMINPIIQKVIAGLLKKRKNGLVMIISAPMSSSALAIEIIKDIIKITCHNSLPDIKIAVYKIWIDFRILFDCDNPTANIPIIHDNIISLRISISTKIMNIINK
nr:hypothetical protein [Aceticella autotrophica]